MDTNQRRGVNMQRNHFLDVLKGILILIVIFVHFPLAYDDTLQFLFPFWACLVIPYFMMISGYVYAISFERRSIHSIGQAYNRILIAEKIIRYTVPYTIAFIAQWIVFRIFGTYQVGIRTYGIFALILDYLRGGKGPGNYYYPLMIQLVFLFPVIYFVIKKYNLKGLFYCFLANAAFEVLKVAYGMNEVEYRLLLFRYLFVIAAGCYVAIGDIKPSKKMTALSILCIITGAGFAYLFSYTNYASKVITYWRSDSFVVCLLMIPTFGWVLRTVHWHFKPLELIGQASFHIFLVQLIYYNFADRMYAIIPGRGLQLTFNIVNCVGAGLLFYYMERPITQYLIKKIRKAGNVH